MHSNTRGKQIVHDDQSDVLLVALIAEHGEELGQGGAGVLLQVHVVAGQQLLQELGLLHADGLQDELIVIGQVKYGPRGSWVGQLSHGFIADRHHEVIRRNTEEVSKVSESHRSVGSEIIFCLRQLVALLVKLFKQNKHFRRVERGILEEMISDQKGCRKF